MTKLYFAIEEVRGGKLLSEIAVGKDSRVGFKGYILNPEQRLFTQESLDEGLVSMGDVDRIKKPVTSIKRSYDEVRKILKEEGATNCVYCARTIDDCVDYDSCEEQTRIK